MAVRVVEPRPLPQVPGAAGSPIVAPARVGGEGMMAVSPMTVGMMCAGRPDEGPATGVGGERSVEESEGQCDRVDVESVRVVGEVGGRAGGGMCASGGKRCTEVEVGNDRKRCRTGVGSPAYDEEGVVDEGEGGSEDVTYGCVCVCVLCLCLCVLHQVL